MVEHKVTIAISPTGASWYDPKLNTMFISRTMTAEEASHAFVHEITHAHWEKAGLTAPKPVRGGISRFEYVNRMCREEAAAESAAIRHKFQSQTNRGQPFHSTSPVEQAYSDGFAAKARELHAATPPMDPALAMKASEQAGEDAVFEAFVHGPATNSVTGESYVMYYGREWDKVNWP
jgi:hypothetical protein